MKNLQEKAKKEHLGIYRKAHAAPAVVAKTPVPAVPVVPAAPPAHQVVAAAPSVPEAGVAVSALINLNSASKDDLMKLPGIGDTFADKFIAALAFVSKVDVKRVAGIGPKKFEAIAPLIEAR